MAIRPEGTRRSITRQSACKITNPRKAIRSTYRADCRPSAILQFDAAPAAFRFLRRPSVFPSHSGSHRSSSLLRCRSSRVQPPLYQSHRGRPGGGVRQREDPDGSRVLGRALCQVLGRTVRDREEAVGGAAQAQQGGPGRRYRRSAMDPLSPKSASASRACKGGDSMNRKRRT